ncbi:MAG: peptide chain release factor 1 [Candidatus Aenigmarchaeota archaeon]|nr:peptide chain release factor 1 [Candidatus Aenigmarchaeota archaeon]
MVDENTYKLKKMLDELDKIRGRHTEMVTVLIPAGYNLQEIVSMLKQEYTLTENVKNKTVRNNVLGAIDKILTEIRQFKKTPKNGLALFAGNVAENEGQTDIQLWSIEPPETLNVKKYWCDKKFEVEALREMVAEKEVYGLLVLDNKEAAIGILKGKKIKMLKELGSLVPGKFRKGGQSAARFERVREGLINDWYKKVAHTAREYFEQTPNLKGIIVGGPGPAKNDFLDGDYLLTSLRKMVLGYENTGYTDEQGLEELVQRAEGILAEAAVAKEKALVQKFFEDLKKGNGLAIYGKDKIMKIMQMGAVDVVLISEGSEDDEIIETAGNFGTAIEIISKDTREGEQLFSLGGLAASLRWKAQ